MKETTAGYIGFVFIVFIVLGAMGWGLNLYKFITADFEEPYAEEIVRLVGIPIPFVGAITGYMTIGSEGEK